MKILNRNVLKIIALITMLIDHIGLVFFPGIEIFRIIGRISFPIFAFMIAEGCEHTENKKKYFRCRLGRRRFSFTPAVPRVQAPS